MKIISPQRALAQLDKAISAWEANPDFGISKEITLAVLKALRKQLADALTGITDTKTELTGLINDRNDSTVEASKLITRVRSAFRGYFGPNSKQYEQVGGTRTDNRKKAVRKKAASLPKAA